VYSEGNMIKLKPFPDQ